MNTRSDQRYHTDPLFSLVRVRDQQTGEVRSLSDEEEIAFWDWTYVEVLRLTGVRVEELVELAHTSIRQYQRPNGEVIALLVIAPSKTDREWTAPMPYLFQRQIGEVRKVTSPGTILNNLRKRCRILGETNPEFRGPHFTPHDFRRLFGMPTITTSR